MDLDESTSRAIDRIGMETTREQAARQRLAAMLAGARAGIARRKAARIIEHQKTETVTQAPGAPYLAGAKTAPPSQALSSKRAPTPGVVPIVRDTPTLFPLHTPSTSTTDTDSTNSTKHQKPLTNAESIRDLFSRHHYPRSPLHPLRAYRPGQTIHLPWNVLPSRLRLENMHHVMAGLAGQEGQCHRAFSLNFGYAFERDLPVEKTRDHVWRAIHRHLKRAGLSCHMVMILERARVDDLDQQAARAAAGLDPLWRVHAHGELACRPESLSGVAATMRKAVGLWEGDAADYQLDLKPNPDRHWLASYVTKAGDAYSCTADLRRKAEDRWEEWRGNENERRRKVAAERAKKRKNTLARRRYRIEARRDLSRAQQDVSHEAFRRD